ncbi:MAG: pseudaminic acid cytidylyltransferase [Selenomonadaceae bacterium]|nr:pseudaminic acid cytidylyltransferase [Selenomonadaceae bacterium]
MSIIAIITARGGSKRIPKKNIKNFCGKPIISYSIKAALDSKLFDEVMVSTDSEEIAAVAEVFGATVPFMRSEKTSDDFAVTADVLKEVVGEYEKQGRKFDRMCCIYPTAPFLTGEKLVKAYDEFEESGADMLQPVVAFSFPPQRSFSMKDGKVSYRYPEFVNARSQDLERWYHDAGQFYFYEVNAFMKSQNTYRGGYILTRQAFVMDEIEVQDIDNLTDWKLAEMKYRLLHEDGLI